MKKKLGPTTYYLAHIHPFMAFGCKPNWQRTHQIPCNLESVRFWTKFAAYL
jgi:hypothetical protein